MKISLNWLNEYIDLSGVSVKEIVDQLTMSGLEVEGVTDQSSIYSNFVVGFVEAREKHPNADKLSVCTVSTGTEKLQVICGASNVEAGQKIILAKEGAVIPKNQFKIGKAKIRGIESFGMICSESELELGPSHEGILILNGDYQEGIPVTEALELNDVIFEIAITPNRPDALSHIGVARDLSAIFNLELKIPEVEIEDKKGDAKKFVSIEIHDPENCPRYTGKIAKNISVKESPGWLKRRLTNIGLRPINNIVDVTNYVMHECGQPLHAFDLNLLNGSKIIVRSTEAEESFTTLDSKQRKLPLNTLLICDAEKPVAVAGVMGGENSEINQSTKNILIESAYFYPSSIRKTAKAMGMSTDASYRFERGTNPDNTAYAAERAAELIAEISGGEIINGILDEYPNKIKRKEIIVRFKRVDKVLGYHLSHNNILQILKKLGFKILMESDRVVHVETPNFRPDIEREIDIIEEIARINGYDNIPSVAKISVTLEHRKDDSAFTDSVRNISESLGLYEMINNPLQNEKIASVTGKPVPVMNPLSMDMAYLRTSLIPGALEAVSRNIKVGEKNLFLYETGNVFNLKDENISGFGDFTEEQKFLIVICGHESEKQWNQEEKITDFYSLKSLVNNFLLKISLDNVLNDSYNHSGNRIYEYYFSKNFNNKEVGLGGKIKKEILKQFDIDQDVFCFEFNIDKIKQIETKSKKYSDLLRYPKIIRDFAFVFDNFVTYEEVKKFIQKESSNLLKSVHLFDLFESGSLGEDKKSLAFSLEFYEENRTLTEEEVEKEFGKLIDLISSHFNAKLRG